MHAESGIVHQNFDGTTRVAEAIDYSSDVTPVRQVGRQHLDGATEGPQLGSHLVEAIDRSSDENEIVSTRSEESGERGTNARRPTGDESYTHAVRLRCSGGTGCLNGGSDGSKGLKS